MKKAIEWLIVLTLVGALAGCVATRPPAGIREAIATMNACTPEYVAESNGALEQAGHPDAERLEGIGTRLQTGMEALNRWANGEAEGQADGQEGGAQ